jgi:inosine-uridine nucleoside N-ribohydrolase
VCTRSNSAIPRAAWTAWISLEMQFPFSKPPIGIVFDCAMGRKIDDVLALAMLHGFEGRKEARLAAVSISVPDVKAAQFCDAINVFYSGTGAAFTGGSRRGLPVGLADGSPPRTVSPMLGVSLAYRTEIRSAIDTAEVATVIRNALTAQYDQNAAVVLSGPATDLAKALDLRDTKELIARKVKLLCVAGGRYPDGAAEWNIQADMAAARKVFAEWPTPVVAAGFEIGAALLFPAASIERDFAWNANHPIVAAYRAYQPMPYDAPSWAMAAMLYAVRPKENYFQVSPPGTIRVSDDGRTEFMPSEGGRHRYLLLDAEQKERIVRAYTELVSAKPVERKPKRPAA